MRSQERRAPLGYPGIRTAMKASDAPTAKDVRTEERPYLCVAYATEKELVQPFRLAAAVAGGPILVYASSQLPREREALRTATFLIGVAMSVWSGWVWKKASDEMKTTGL